MKKESKAKKGKDKRDRLDPIHYSDPNYQQEIVVDEILTKEEKETPLSHSYSEASLKRWREFGYKI